MNKREIMQLTNYPGLSVEPAVFEAGQKALNQYGTGSSCSRLLSVNLNLYQQLENQISCLKETQATLYKTHLNQNNYVRTSKINHSRVRKNY